MTESKPETHILRSRDGVHIPYSIRLNRRAKTLRITVSPYEGVIVTIPTRARHRVDPEKFLREKRDWVLKHLNTLEINPAEKNIVDDGSTIFFQGRTVTLRIRRVPRIRTVGCDVLQDELVLLLPESFQGDPKDALIEWLKDRATERINQYARIYAKKMDISYPKLTIRDQRTKWGSCSKEGNLSFNWRLILFPPEILRYIVVHELCHIRHFHHKPTFWQLVEQYDPHYRMHVKWLKENGLRMEAALL